MDRKEGILSRLSPSFFRPSSVIPEQLRKNKVIDCRESSPLVKLLPRLLKPSSVILKFAGKHKPRYSKDLSPLKPSPSFFRPSSVISPLLG